MTRDDGQPGLPPQRTWPFVRVRPDLVERIDEWAAHQPGRIGRARAVEILIGGRDDAIHHRDRATSDPSRELHDRQGAL